jgi:hypothetical protein
MALDPDFLGLSWILVPDRAKKEEKRKITQGLCWGEVIGQEI